MDYVIGFLAGILVAVLVGAILAYLFLRDKTPLALTPAPAPAPGLAAVTIALTESFLNQQLQASVVPVDGVGAANPSAIPQSFGPFKIKLNSAQLDLLPLCRARLTLRLTVTAIGINLNLCPAAEFYLVPEAARIRIHVTRILLEGINIPRHWVDSFITAYVAGAEQQLNRSFHQLETETHVNLSSIETSDDVLILKFS